jgi:hypothetical protein
MTSKFELDRAAKSLGLHSFVCIRKKELPKWIHKRTHIIMNLDDFGPGSHWVALHTPSKQYYDSFGQPPPNVVPASYSWKAVQEQEVDEENCGERCLQWLTQRK